MEKQKQCKTLIIVYSYHHNNTLKVANVFGNVLDAQIISPEEMDKYEMDDYDLIGFGSGIAGEKHYQPLLSLAKELLIENHKLSFIFSTSAIQGKSKVAQDHATLRSILTSKGYVILDEFSCKGFNTNSFLKYFGGMNKGRPNAMDLKQAEAFAINLKARYLNSLVH